MKQTVIIESGADGTFSAFAPDMQNVPVGTGATVEETVRDFLACIGEMRDVYREDGRPVPDELEADFDFRYDVPSLFAAFPFLNMSRTAEAMGINASVMRRYACAGGRISRYRKKAIEDGIRAIGERLLHVSIA